MRNLLPNIRLHSFFAVFFAIVMGVTASLRGQQVAAASLPDAPLAGAGWTAENAGLRAAATASGSHTTADGTRLSFVPRFQFLSADSHFPPQSVKEKFLYATEDNIDVFSIGVPALSAGFKQLINATPEFRHGPAAYGRYYWHSWVDRASEDYIVEFIVPAVTHEDTRYYTLGPGHSATRRLGYALSRAVITRNDAGNETFNASEVIGAGAAAGISNLYYPRPERTAGSTIGKWGTNVGFDAAAFVLHEFWPDINHLLFHGQKPMPGQ